MYDDNMGLAVRPAVPEDFDRFCEIYASAREFMRRSGNPNQWRTNRPAPETIARDIRTGISYAVMSGQRVCGVFTFSIGEDPTYRSIDGEWLNSEPYGAIHRIASDGTVRGVFSECLKFCLSKIGNIKIDTHRDNAVMRRRLSDSGFKFCGVIITDDGTPRMAFQLCRRDGSDAVTV